MPLTKLEQVMQNDLGYNPDDKAAFHRLAKSSLRKLAVEMGLEKGDYDLRSNKGGIAVSGEVTLHADHIYVKVSQSCLGPGREILFRTCSGRKDYTGDSNNFASVSALSPAKIGTFARQLNSLIERKKSAQAA